MRILKAIIVFIGFTVFLLVAAAAHIMATLLKPSARWHIISSLSSALIRFLRNIVGIKLYLKGDTGALKEKGNFIITRHVGYTDGLILGGLFPSIFISKREVQGWPVFGAVVWISGTVFVDRVNKNKVSGSLEKIVSLLKKKHNIIIFPEGTSTDGTQIK